MAGKATAQDVHQWHAELLVGFARSFQINDIHGGIEFGGGVYRTGRLTFGIEGSRFHLGDSETTRTDSTLFPTPQVTTTISERERSGWRLNAIVRKPLGDRLTLNGGVGYYRVNSEDVVEERDSPGAVIKPRTVTEGSSAGPGAVVGVGLNMSTIGDRLGIKLTLDSHFTFLKGSEAGAGREFIHYASGGIRLSVGF
jgi:hypothetical protein